MTGLARAARGAQRLRGGGARGESAAADRGRRGERRTFARRAARASSHASATRSPIRSRSTQRPRRGRLRGRRTSRGRARLTDRPDPLVLRRLDLGLAEHGRARPAGARRARAERPKPPASVAAALGSWPARRDRSPRCTNRRTSCVGSESALDGAAARAAGLPDRDQRVGVVVHAVPHRVPAVRGRLGALRPPGRVPRRRRRRLAGDARAFLAAAPGELSELRDDQQALSSLAPVAGLPTTIFLDRAGQGGARAHRPVRRRRARSKKTSRRTRSAAERHAADSAGLRACGAGAVRGSSARVDGVTRRAGAGLPCPAPLGACPPQFVTEQCRRSAWPPLGIAAARS